MSANRRRYDDMLPPRNWPRDDQTRRQPTNKTDQQYYNNIRFNQLAQSEYSPDNLVGGGRLDVTSHASAGMDLTSDVPSGARSSSLLSHKAKKPRTTQFDYSRGMRNDSSLMPPIRQTASIFKQPVTVHRTQHEGKSKADFKHGVQEKPKQLFWEKRLEGLRACDIDGRELMVMELPRSLKTIGAHINSETILQSVATALHLSTQPVTGQTSTKTKMEKNPGVFINPEQPLVQALSIGDDDIKRQEERVMLARRKLQDALVR